MHTESVGKVVNEMIYSMPPLSIFRLYLSRFVYQKPKSVKRKFAHTQDKSSSKCKRWKIERRLFIFPLYARGKNEVMLKTHLT